MGGPQNQIPDGDTAALFAAIERFQTQHRQALGISSPDGIVDPKGATLALLYKKARPIAKAVPLPIPKDAQHMQTDYRWWLVNLNTTSGFEYTFLYRACALSALATTFAARGLRLSDVAEVEKIANRKHAAAKVHLTHPKVGGRPLLDHGITDFGAINPLTLDAWMTGGSSRGFESKALAELNWEKVAAVSPRVRFVSWIMEKIDRRFPSPALLRAWLNQSLCVIGKLPSRSPGHDHFVVLAGYEGEVRFLTFDVGYGADANQPEGYKERKFEEFIGFVTYSIGP